MKAQDLFRVDDLVAVVTGGAKGIGSSIVAALADNGAEVVVLDRDRTALERLVESYGAKHHNVTGVAMDLCDRPLLRKTLSDLARERGRLDVVFANAGVTAGPGFLTPDLDRDPEGAIENIPDELWQRVVSINLDAVFATLQAAAIPMAAARRGRIIVTSSVGAYKTSPMVGTPYMATKAGVAHLVRQAASELAAYNVTVNAILPGPFLTDMTTPALEEGFKRASPSRRAARLEEMQGLTLFLASNASSFVTGAHYVIDGGMLLGPAD